MELQQLKYLLKVAECGSITKAAQQLFLSQPSVTKSIIKLEDEYKIRIFNRTPRGVEITPDGKEFLYYARSVVTSARMLDKVFSSKTQNKHILSVATIQLDFLHSALIKLYQTHSDDSMHFNVVESNRSAAIHSVLDGSNDLGVIVRSSHDSKAFSWLLGSKNLETHIIDTSGVYVSMGPGSPFYHKKEVSFYDLKEQLHIVIDMEDEAIRDLYLDPETNHVNMKRIIFFNSIGACTQFLNETDAHMYMNKWLLGFFKGTNIRSVEIKPEAGFKMPTIELLWLKRKNEPLNGIEQEFIDAVQRSIAQR